MKKILIIGSGGSGKSTLAVRLGELLQLPVIHLDEHFWQPGWVEPPREEWKTKVDEFCSRDAWIMDGNYGGTLEERITASDTVLFLDRSRPSRSGWSRVIYLMDYGAPVGFRIAAKHPERVETLIIQNGNAYDEGLREFWDPIREYWNDRTPENAEPLKEFITPEGVKWQYTHGVRDPQAISPDNWNIDHRHLSREGNPAIQLALFYDYQNNVPLYPSWQAYFLEHQPPTLIVWGKNDYIFPAEGAHPYKRDLKNLEFHLLDTGHFALEEDGDVIASHIRRFLDKHLQ